MILNENQKELLNSIHKKLHWGDIRDIAEITSLSKVYVGKVLNPETDTFNMKVVETAAKIIATREQSTRKLLNKIS